MFPYCTDQLPSEAEPILATLVDTLATRWSRLWIAYSGGLDSHVLLHGCCQLRAWLPPLAAVHIDHGLHPDSAHWAVHCQQVCDALNLPLHICRVRVTAKEQLGIEAAAREARYAAWRALLVAGEALATAQHQDDQAETLLLALLRGSGIDGLAAMPQQTTLGAGTLIRPLLALSRSTLVGYAKKSGLQWLEDPSNQDTQFMRNYLRAEIMPRLTARWPSAAHTLSRSAAHCAASAALLDEYAAHWLNVVRGIPVHTLSVTALSGLTLNQRRLAMRAWLKQQGFQLPNQARLESMVTTLLTTRPDADPCVQWPSGELRRYRDGLYALRPLPQPPTTTLRWAGTEPLILGQELGSLCWQSPPATWRQFRVRFAVHGLRCRAYPSGAHRRTLKQVFQTQGIPPWLRPLIPLVFEEETLIAIAGVVCCAPQGQGLIWRDHPWEALLNPQPTDASITKSLG